MWARRVNSCNVGAHAANSNIHVWVCGHAGTRKGLNAMTIDELKALLKDGKLTQEQFMAMAKTIDPNYTEPEPDPERENDDTNPEPDPEPNIEQLIQRAVDRATNKLGNDNKKLRQQLEELKKSKLTADEAAELERRQREDDLAEREKALQDEKNRWYAMKAIKKAGLDDGGDDSLAIVDLVMGGTEADIDARVQSFDKLVKKIVKAEVDKTFRQHGRNPEQGAGGGEKNPWAKDSRNITAQMRLELTDPERAARLKAAAGVK